MSDTGEKLKFQALAEQDAKLGPARAVAKHLAKVALGLPVPTDDLHGDFLPIVQKILEKARELGHDLIIVEGFRSVDWQQRYYDQGRKTQGTIITYAEPLESYHQYGLAVDLYFAENTEGEAGPVFWQELGKFAKTLGCEWGGDWGDIGHFEYHPEFKWQELKAYFESENV